MQSLSVCAELPEFMAIGGKMSTHLMLRLGKIRMLAEKETMEFLCGVGSVGDHLLVGLATWLYDRSLRSSIVLR